MPPNTIARNALPPWLSFAMCQISSPVEGLVESLWLYLSGIACRSRAHGLGLTRGRGGGSAPHQIEQRGKQHGEEEVDRNRIESRVTRNGTTKDLKWIDRGGEALRRRHGGADCRSHDPADQQRGRIAAARIKAQK